MSSQNKMYFISKHTNNEITKKEHKSTESQSCKSPLEIILHQPALPAHPSHNSHQFGYENREAGLGTKTLKVRKL